MRITNNMMTNQFLSGYQKDLSTMNNIQEKIASSKNINRPSDDPVKAARSLQFSTAANTNTILTQNVNDGISWMTSSESAMSTIVTTMSSISTKVSSAISANPTSSYDAIAKQVDESIKTLVQNANQKVGDRYVFGGQKDTTEPFKINYDTSGNMTSVTYSGTYDGESGNATAGTITMQASPGSVDPSRDKINVDGRELFGAIDATGQPQIFKDLLAIRQHLADIKTGANGVTADTLSSDIGTISADSNLIVNAQTTIGARQSSYATIKTRLIEDDIQISSDAKDNDGYDVAKVSTDMQLAENAYNSLLSIGAKILPKSLADYL